MSNTAPAYGLWVLVIINSAVFILFALSRREEREARAVFGVAYDRYAAVTPAFVPRPDGRRRAGRGLPSPGASV